MRPDILTPEDLDLLRLLDALDEVRAEVLDAVVSRGLIHECFRESELAHHNER